MLVVGLPLSGPWDFYLLPRPFELLYVLDPALLARAEQVAEGGGPGSDADLRAQQVRRFYGIVEEKGLAFSQARLEEGLARTVDWYLANEDWWRPLLDTATERRGLGT